MESFGAGYVALPCKHDGGNLSLDLETVRVSSRRFSFQCTNSFIGESLTNEVESTLNDDITPIATKL